MTGTETSLGAKCRAYSGPAFFGHGFRPFFFSAALFAGLVIPIWMAAFSHGYRIGAGGDALGWHAHEMIFGYAGAVLGGFVIWFLWIEAEPLGNWVMSVITAPLPEDSSLAQHLIAGAAYFRYLLMGGILLVVMRFAPRGLIPGR